MTQTAEVSKWKYPQELDAVTCAFPANALEFMPAMNEIPDEFRQFRPRDKWQRFVADWFFCGLKNIQITTKEGVDQKKAIRHLGAIIGSFAPKHEHKEAAAAYLCSLWFEDAKWDRGK